MKPRFGMHRRYHEAAEKLGHKITRTNHKDYSEPVMRAMPGTMSQLVEASGISHYRMQKYVRQLRACKWVYIGGWVRAVNGFQPVYHAGVGRDQPCQLKPKVVDHRAAYRRRKRKLLENDEWDFFIARKSAKLRIKRIAESGVKATPFDALLR